MATEIACLPDSLSLSFHRKKGFGGTAGMAFVGTACSRSHGGGINAVWYLWSTSHMLQILTNAVSQCLLNSDFHQYLNLCLCMYMCAFSPQFTNNNVMSFSSIVAHELGHNLGMNHDDGRNCKCDVTHCIMNSGATWVFFVYSLLQISVCCEIFVLTRFFVLSGSRNFSSCSADDFEKMILNSGGRCLLNVPRPDEAYSAPFCGNKLVDVGEECDCGSEEVSSLITDQFRTDPDLTFLKNVIIVGWTNCAVEPVMLKVTRAACKN